MTGPLELLQSYFSRGVVVDSNLLLLLFVGSFDRRQIDRNSRLEKFDQADFELLVKLLGRFKLLVTTPHILTEVSNLSAGIAGRERQPYFDSFAKSLTLLDEQQVASHLALTGRWAKLGLTDAAIAAIAKQKYLVITDDFEL